ncbi:MAG: TolC family protein [Chitinophagaceae bacterium]|nr:TolC family protein [Chitinophagaceae bacterium]
MKKLFLLISCFAALQGFCQPKLTLTDAINTALKNSYDIQLAQNNIEISNISNNYGYAGGLPVVTGTATDNEQVTSINQKFPDPSRDTKRNNVGTNNLAASITGSMLLYNGLRVQATKKRLEELEQQNQQLLSVQVQNTIAAVMAKYYDILRQQYFLKTIERTIEVSKQKLKIIEVRKEAGVANNADIFQAQLDLNANLQTKESQFLAIDQAKTDLLNLIFLRPADQKIIIEDTIIVDKSVRLDSVLKRLSSNPQIVATQQQVHINELIEKEVLAARYPTLRASTGYNLSSAKSAAGFILLNQSYGPFVGLNLSVPIYNGSVTKKQQQIASINTRNSKVAYENVLLDFETGTVKTYQAYNNALGQLKTEMDNYKLSQQLLDLISQKFELGQATIIDVKQAQQSFENASYRLINLTYTAKVAEVELKRLASQLSNK